MDGRRARIVLGVGNDAGPAEIRRAFRARALRAHPDHGGDRAAFAELTDALATLDALFPAPAPCPRVAPIRIPIALATGRPRFDAYDSPSRPAPRRTFADALQAATALFA
ncbi:MAG TPA: DnaJ domain-containing protein [Acidimicrobiia bacterium]|nr:DnaJ domain-containing protein [Acidimicrobiia bacterium]